MKLKAIWLRVLYVSVVVLALACSWVFQLDSFLVNAGVDSDWLALPTLSLFWWLLAVAWVLTYPRTMQRYSSPVMLALIGLVILVPTWVAVIGLHASGEKGPMLVMYLLSLIWVADSGAYFGGRKWGKRKLAPSVSPGKSWEGVGSGAALSVAYAFGAAQVLDLPGNQWSVFVVLSLVTVFFSVLGDLTESMFKRHAGMKDSGTLLPGHGGVLDRIDSVTAAAPVFVVGLWLAGLMGTVGQLGISVN